MARPFRFAVQALALTDRDRVAAQARQVESLGYDELYSYDHLGAVDPFAPLVVAAEAAPRLRVGPLVLNNEFHHPVLLARMAATMDRMTEGRFVLGMGTGYAQSEHDAMGLELRPPGTRVDRFEECLTVLRELLDDGACELDGSHHCVQISDLPLKPVAERVPILIGGHGRRVVGLAGRFADIFQFTGLVHAADGTPTPGGFRVDDVADRARWLSEAAGDRDGDIERSVLVQGTALGDGSAAALAEASAGLGMPPAEIRATPFMLFGSVEQIVDELETRREGLGISHVVVRDAEGFAPVVEALAGR